MKCPLKDFFPVEGAQGNFIDGTDCIKEECAWWRDDIQMCAIKDLSLELGYTQMRLQDIDHRLDAMTAAKRID